jgi:hypothetical protein
LYRVRLPLELPGRCFHLTLHKRDESRERRFTHNVNQVLYGLLVGNPRGSVQKSSPFANLTVVALLNDFVPLTTKTGYTNWTFRCS